MSKLLHAWWGCLAFLCVLPSASAYDSVPRGRTHSVPTNLYFPQQVIIEPDSLSEVRHNFAVNTYALGGRDPNGVDDEGITGVYVCDKSLVEDVSEFENCRLAQAEDLTMTPWGWLEPRKSWDSPEGAEHLHIAVRAAELSGLLNRSSIVDTNLLFERSYVRYPVLNRYLVSPLENHPTVRPEDYGKLHDLIVGPSWLPVGFDEAESFVVRGFSLLELSQLADMSYSVASWAAGNEICPIDMGGVADGQAVNLYVGQSNTTACFMYPTSLGPLNATHFLPRARAIYDHYHQLALDRMDDCALLDEALRPVYDAWKGNLCSDQNPAPCDVDVFRGSVETLECEREAFVYEMYAQHFLQDAWSTGHMFKRYGETETVDFPDTVHSSAGVLNEVFYSGNVPFRRAAFASVMAVQSGMVHGAKSVLADLAQDLPRSFFEEHNHECARDTCGVFDFIDGLGVLDDPLCAPSYFERVWPFPGPSPIPLVRRDTEFVSSAYSTVDAVQGAGDLFWSPAPPRASISVDPEFEFQRARLLGCAAASMREVYMRGPGAHGTPDAPLEVSGFYTAGESINIESIVPTSEDCWSQWATNASMQGAIGALGGTGSIDHIQTITYDFDFVDLINNFTFKAGVFPLATDVPGDSEAPAFGAVNFPFGPLAEANDIDEWNARYDRDQFRAGMEKAMEADISYLKSIYALNDDADPIGTESARGVKFGADAAEIVFLGFRPSEPTLPRYADELVTDSSLPQGSVDPRLHFAVNNMFWRSHAAQTCEATSDGEALRALRSRCVEGAETGGDAAACTACTALAELHMPPCSSITDPVVTSSKCEALGSNRLTGSDFAWWYDGQLRRSEPGTSLGSPDDYQSDEVLCNHAPLQVAFQWCTGTYSTPIGTTEAGSTLMQVRSDLQVTHTETCGDDLMPTERRWGTRSHRVGIVLDEEPGANVMAESSQPFVFPTVTAFTDTQTTQPSADPCGLFPNAGTVSTLDGVLGDAIAPASVWDNVDLDIRSEIGHNYDLKVRRCGPTQRLSVWNTSCEVATQSLGLTPTASSAFDPLTGFEVRPSQFGCVVREPRAFLGSCGPDGTEGCSTMGYCTSGAGANFQLIDVNFTAADF